MYFLVNTSPKLLDKATSNIYRCMSYDVEGIGKHLMCWGQGHIMYFLVNASP